LEERNVAQEASRRRFHKEGPMTVKDLDLAIVFLARGEKEVPSISGTK